MRKQMYADEPHPDVLLSLNSLAAYNDSIGRYAEADRYRDEAERLRVRISNSMDPEYATSMNNVGVSYLRLGDLRLALQYIEQVYIHEWLSELIGIVVLFVFRLITYGNKYTETRRKWKWPIRFTIWPWCITR